MFNQKENESFASTDNFKKMADGNGDILMYINMGVLPANTPLAQVYGMNGMKPSDVEGFLSTSFVDGKMVMTTEVSGKTEAAKKMLEESSEGRCPHCGRKLGEGEDECSGDCCACEESKDGDGDGDSPGSGGVSRGRDDAPLDFGDETQLGASKLKDLAEKAGLAGNPSVTKVGESISNEDPAKRGVPSSPGARRAIGGRSQGASAGQNVLPRHRGTVKRFFDIERKAP